jgi:hypothetical protein
VGCCAHVNEVSVSIKCTKFLNLAEKEMDFQEGRCSDVDCWCSIPAAYVKFVIT